MSKAIPIFKTDPGDQLPVGKIDFTKELLEDLNYNDHKLILYPITINKGDVKELIGFHLDVEPAKG